MMNTYDYINSITQKIAQKYIVESIEEAEFIEETYRELLRDVEEIMRDDN